MFLNRERQRIGTELCTPVYIDWMISETLNGKITANGFLESWRDPMQYETFGAWTASDWSGAIKPSTDMLKTGKSYKLQVEENFISRDRATREVSGMKFSKVVRRNKKANEMIADAMRPLLELKKEFGEQVDDPANAAKLESKIDDIIEEAAERAVELLASDA